MSQANVKIARRAIDAWNRRDVEGFFGLAASDFDWFPALAGTVEGDSYRGREGMERYFEMVSDTWEELHVIGEGFRDLGESVLAVVRIEGRGRGSGVPIAGRQTAICEFRDGKLSRVRSYFDHGEALRAAGVTE
jgi:ketosteroid isomerase-like protein